MKDNPIGIFDSGLGGLSILRGVKKLLPNENIIYLADHKNAPYGSKTAKEIISLTLKALTYLEKQNVKLVVLACNTSTVVGISEYREKFAFPIVGVVPVVKKAAKMTKNGIIGIISTPITAKSKYQKDLINKFCKNTKKVINIGCKNLVTFVENGEISSPKLLRELKKYLEPIIKAKADILALGCTHYSFLKRSIKKVAPNIKILDSSRAVARQVKRILKNENMESVKRNSKSIYKTTGNPLKVIMVAQKLLKEKIIFSKATV